MARQAPHIRALLDYFIETRTAVHYDYGHHSQTKIKVDDRITINIWRGETGQTNWTEITDHAVLRNGNIPVFAIANDNANIVFKPRDYGWIFHLKRIAYSEIEQAHTVKQLAMW